MSSRSFSGTPHPTQASRLALLAILAALVAACAPFWEIFAPRVPSEWAALVDDIRAFEQRIGFAATDNFTDLTEERNGIPFCGYASRLSLPYSYQDPAIQWRANTTEQECGVLAGGSDTYFSTVEALGEIGTPITQEMVSSKLDRFLYVVIHEDCHDQFELPYGVEEALCNLITYKAMAAFSDEKFGAKGREDRAIRGYAAIESERTRATIVHYEQLATLYGRYERNEIAEDALLRERAPILVRATRALAWRRGALNNVGIASDMTYSRHYPFLEEVFNALGRDLARTVAFFKRVDRLKPSPAAVMKRHGIANEESLEFIRAYEAAVMETVKKALGSE